jgi:hypothetical protein
MKKSVNVLALLFSAAAICALQVDKDELAKGQGGNIIFIDYVGPHTKIDTLDQIFGIGRILGQNVGDKPSRSDYAGKYRVIHAVGAEEAGKLDADIFIIEASAGVDEVINIMRMVCGFLQTAYGYSQADGMLLARFTLYYNAVFRGNMKYLDSVYKSFVMTNLSPDNAGIATRYSDWPGKTRMVIPLSSGAQKGNLSAVGTNQLAAPSVVENLQSQPGKALPERKDLAELQQRGIEQDQQQLAEEQQRLQQEKQQLQAQTQELEQATRTAAETHAAAAVPGASPEQLQAAAQAQAATQAQEKAVQAQAEKVQQQEQAVTQKQQQISANQQGVQQQRQGIAADEQAQIKEQQAQERASAQAASTPAAPPETPSTGQVLFVYVPDPADPLGELVLIDQVSGKLLSKSDLNSVRGRLFVNVGGLIVVAAGRAAGNAAVRLVSLDPASLAIQQTGKDNLVPTTYLTASGSSVYAVIDSGHGAYLGRFDKTLTLQAQSERKVDQNTFITVSGSEVFVQDDAGNILILDKDDLKEKKKTG